MMYICFVTCTTEPALSKDDQLLAQYLSERNIKVNAEIWDDPEVNWVKYDAIVLRSMWDYHTKANEFNRWLDQLADLGCFILNPIAVVYWNQNKKYLVDFAEKGINVPPTHFCYQNGEERLSAIRADHQWDKIVIKPAVSGGSFNTWTTTATNAIADETRFGQMLQLGDVIVRKFMEEVVAYGELSLLFFNKKFSHAIIKKAKTGDFRVQYQFGGTAESIELDEQLVNEALKLIDQINEPLLYARVDGILVADKFYLMELELIEPALFIAYSDAACEKFYTALRQLMAGNLSKNQVARLSN